MDLLPMALFYFALLIMLPGPQGPQFTLGIPIDNGILGDPIIECESGGIRVSIDTQNRFQGKIYVKGQYDYPECRTVGETSLELPFESCNIRRQRIVNPRGVNVATTVIVSFHPTFITKVDRAYRISCFYMEAEKTVETDLEVSMLTTSFNTANVAMPVCTYEILDGPGGNPVRYALVGESVFHKWNCITDTVDAFCMRVHSCAVDDGQGDTVLLLDSNGCSLDPFLLQNLEYPMDMMAGQESHVFKYADRLQLFFQCQISITVKEQAGECPEPQCYGGGVVPNKPGFPYSPPILPPSQQPYIVRGSRSAPLPPKIDEMDPVVNRLTTVTRNEFSTITITDQPSKDDTERVVIDVVAAMEALDVEPFNGVEFNDGDVGKMTSSLNKRPGGEMVVKFPGEASPFVNSMLSESQINDSAKGRFCLTSWGLVLLATFLMSLVLLVVAVFTFVYLKHGCGFTKLAY